MPIVKATPSPTEIDKGIDAVLQKVLDESLQNPSKFDFRVLNELASKVDLGAAGKYRNAGKWNIPVANETFEAPDAILELEDSKTTPSPTPPRSPVTTAPKADTDFENPDDILELPDPEPPVHSTPQNPAPITPTPLPEPIRPPARHQPAQTQQPKSMPELDGVPTISLDKTEVVALDGYRTAIKNFPFVDPYGNAGTEAQKAYAPSRERGILPEVAVRNIVTALRMSGVEIYNIENRNFNLTTRQGIMDLILELSTRHYSEVSKDYGNPRGTVTIDGKVIAPAGFSTSTINEVQ
jgi:hypothetical protein